jgi:hypothetical protein
VTGVPSLAIAVALLLAGASPAQAGRVRFLVLLGLLVAELPCWSRGCWPILSVGRSARAGRLTLPPAQCC